MPEVSIILPSLRLDAALRTIKEFSVTNGNIDYEILVVSPFPVKEDRVVHIYEGKALGTIRAHNVAYENSSGKYILPWADDHYPTVNCISNMLSFVKSNVGPFIGSFRSKVQGKEVNRYGVYNRPYACFGCFSKQTVNLVGGYYDIVYNSYWSDPDMALRTWEKGGKVKVCPNAWIISRNIGDQVEVNNWNNYFEKDKETFLNRWHHKLGNGIARELVNKEWTLINKPLDLKDSF
jgi:glycosyltransferase involved in cell wall biosynthesis